MAVTLVDMLKGMKDDVMKGVVLNLARQSPVFQLIPFDTTDSFITKAWTKTEVAEADFRSIGTTYAESKDVFTERFEPIALMGNKLDIDRALRLPGQTELDAYVENLADESNRLRYRFLRAFIDGDRAVTPDGFDGIKKRVEAIGGDQVLNLSALDLSASSANRQTFLDKIQEAMFEVAEGMPDLILSSKQGMWALERVARREGLLDTTQDAFDRKIKSFMGIPIEWAGTQGDQSTPIITNTETAAGARTGGNTTSFYFIRFGKPYVTGMQMHEPKRIFDGITDDGVTHRVVFQWPVGLLQFHDKAVVRYRNVKVI